MSIKHLYPTSTPALNLNPKSSRVADPRLSCVRNSIGTYVDPVSGLVKTAPANVARVEKDGLLVEESRTNVLKRSESMWHSDWTDQVTGNGGSATQSSTDVDPSGNNNALKIVSKSSASSYHAIYQNGSLSNSTTYTFSVYAKANGYNFIGMSLGSPCATSGVFFNLSTGAVGTTNGSGWTPKITTAGNGWYRCQVTKTTNNESYPQIETHSADNQGSYTGDGSSGVLLWGAQCEQGSFSTSYIPTSGSTVQRLADQITLTNSGIFNPRENTIINEPFGVAGGSDTLTVVGDGSKAERIFVYNGYLTQEQTNTLTGKDDDWWEWRVLGNSFGLPGFTTNGQVSVDWGDGTVETLTTSDHTFTNGNGYHTIKFRLDSGTYFQPTNNGAHRNKLISLGPAPISMTIGGRRAFDQNTNLKTVDATLTFIGGGFDPLLHNMQNCFNGCFNLLSIPLLNTDGILSFSWAFRNTNYNFYMAPINVIDGITFENCWQYCAYLKEFPAGFFDNWTGTPANRCFSGTWNNCPSLSSQSVENILNSINTSGQSAPSIGPNITIDYDTSTGVPFGGTLSSGVITPTPAVITSLKSRNWDVSINGTSQ